jgi:hypothetical protein
VTAQNGKGDPLDYFEFMDAYGPVSDAEDEVNFPRLDEFGRNVWRLPSASRQEIARQFWERWLHENSLLDQREARRVVRAAVEAGKNGIAESSTFEPVLVKDLAPGKSVDWVVKGYAPGGGLTVVAGPPKAGKTTYVAGMAVQAAASGIPVLWLDLEQHATRTRDLFARLDAIELPIFAHSSASRVPMNAIARCVTEHEIGLVIIDSLSRFWTVEDENDAAQVTTAMGELLAFARSANVAVIVIHHTRKSGGSDGSDIRGSGAIAASVDVAVSFQRYGDGPARLLEAISRYDETPRRLVVEYREGRYCELGSEADVRDREARERVRAALTDEPLARSQIAKDTGLPDATVARVTEALHEEGLVERAGEGKRGDPFTYRVGSPARGL